MKRFLVCTVAVVAVLSLGLVLIHCGSGDDDKQCETNPDCPEGYWCDRTVWECKLIDCIPDCSGQCCGNDPVCGEPCPDNCTGATTCNTQTCQCESTGCSTDEDCLADQCCNLQGVCEDMNCGNLQCGPDPVCGFECGPCQQGFHCDMGTCVEDVACTDDDDCLDTECCLQGTCEAMTCGALQCGPDPTCQKECGPCDPGYTCNNGICEEQTVAGDCPVGQDCVDMSGSGYYGCIIPPSTIPPGNQTDCDPANDIFCDGNYTCFQVDPGTVCIENCGTCPAGLTCFELWADGPWGCLKPDGGLPDTYPNCDAAACPGNMTCYGLTSGGTACIDNCSVGYGCDTNGETRCLGDTVQTCVNLAWEDTTDCTATNQICANGACVTPPGLGEFCEDTGKCAAGLDCIGLVDPPSTHSFCTPQCDCANQTGCDTGWECLFGSGDPPTVCWCAKLCTTAADCPDGGGGGFTCEVLATDGQGNDIYGCMIQ